ncbi:unnamed protein product, partial [Cuscuta europaea]
MPNLSSILDFSDCIAACNLISPNYNGPLFTWAGVRSNGWVWRRLDRFLFNSRWSDSFKKILVDVLEKTPSDHSPLLIACFVEGTCYPKPFKFQNMWTHHATFLDTVKKSWDAIDTYGGMRGFVHKLKQLKLDLKLWNRNTFGNLFEDIKVCEDQVMKAERLFESCPSEENIENWQHFRALFAAKHKLERKYWNQKANIKWLKEGDANTNHFHSYVQTKHRKHSITTINNSRGEEVTSQADIGDAAITLFSDLYSVDPDIDAAEILKFIPHLVLEEDNNMLINLPDKDEVKTAVWKLDQNSAPGPDGFNGKFFRKCWHIIGDDLVRAIQEFFMGIPIPRGVASSLVVLISKVDNPSSFGEFRPICLSNFISKVCTKILVDRLSSILPKLISPEQIGFMNNKDIVDHVLIA